MAFPTIPTTAANTLLSSTTSPASTTHTFPSLTTLAPQAGDLIIAICVQYDGTTSGQFGSWGASLTEILDSQSTGTGAGALGVAYKTASGSESGTFTVTSADSFKSINFLMRIPAGEWRSTTAPEVMAATRAATAVANPGSFDPSWGTEDTLWIAVAGHTETTTAGSPPTLTTPPSNYSGELIVARAGDAIGEITAAVAFRQLNASSEDVGTWTATNANRGNGIATVLAIRPEVGSYSGQVTTTYDVSIVTSGTAEDTRRRGLVSWASFEAPSVAVSYGQTTLTETVALTIQGSSVLKGNTTLTENVSIDTLGESELLGNTTLTEDVAITANGVRIAYGIVNKQIDVTLVTDGSSVLRGQTTLTEDVSVITDGSSVLKGQTTLTENVGIVTSAKVGFFGDTTLTEDVAIVTNGTSSSGAMDWFGEVILGVTDTITTNGTSVLKGQVTFAEDVAIVTSGSSVLKGQATFTENVAIITSGTSAFRSQTTLTETADIVTSGVRTGFGQSIVPIEVSTVTQGSAVAKSNTTLTETVSIVTDGTSSTPGVSYGQTSLTETVGVVTSGVLSYISYVGYESANATSASLPSFEVGDVAYVFAFRDGSDVAPSLPSGWTNITTEARPGLCSSRVGYRVLQAGDTTTGIWTNATEVQVLVLRGAASIGGSNTSGTDSSNEIGYDGFELQGNTGWIVGFCGHQTATDVNTLQVSDSNIWTTRSSAGAATSLGCQTNSVPDAWEYPNGTVNATAAWLSFNFEVMGVAYGRASVAETVQIVSDGSTTSGSRRGLVSWASLEVPAAAPGEGGSVSLDLTDTITTVGKIGAFGKVSLVYPREAAAGLVWLWGDEPQVGISATVRTDGHRQVYGQVSLTEDVSIVTNGARTSLGTLLPNNIVVTVTTAGPSPPSVGVVSLTENVEITTSATKGTFGVTTLEEIVGITTVGNTFHGVIVFTDIVTNIFSRGIVTPKSSASTELTTTVTTIGYFEAFTQIVLPLSLYLHTFAQGNVFLARAICDELGYLDTYYDAELEISQASETDLVLIAAEEE